MVYITSDLFTPDPTLDHVGSSSSIHTHTRNAMVDSQPVTGLGKRKRRVDDGTDGQNAHNCLSHLRSSPASKAYIKLHSHDPAFDANNTRLYPLSVANPTLMASDRRPVKQIKRLNPKVALLKSTSHLMDIEPDPLPSHSKPDRTDVHTSSDLRPCHACKTAPKRKRDLENYMECRRCDGRTCYICARECMSCRKAICKRCIVEVGQEGDPWCLECYSRHINS